MHMADFDESVPLAPNFNLPVVSSRLSWNFKLVDFLDSISREDLIVPAWRRQLISLFCKDTRSLWFSRLELITTHYYSLLLITTFNCSCLGEPIALAVLCEQEFVLVDLKSKEEG